MSCQSLASLSGPGPFYGLVVLDSYVAYSDWASHSVQLLNVETGVTTTIASNLMRPTQIVINHPRNMTGVDNFFQIIRKVEIVNLLMKA